MESKALIVASVASMIDQFNMPNIQLLLDNGYKVDVVCNCKVGNTVSLERVEQLKTTLAEKGVRVIHAPIPRKISDIAGIRDSIKLLKKIMDDNDYRFMHCHSPIGSVVARQAAKGARKKGTKVIYTAHGFHFFQGAPKKNWMIFYPIEKYYSRYTDILITINTEDFAFAKKKMHAGRVEYIPGVGIDTSSFYLTEFDKGLKKKEIGINPNDIMILSVGELNKNKNQEVIIKAIAKLNKNSDREIHYFIAGKGDNDKYLEDLANELKVNLHLLGYRTDIKELLNASDIYAFPSRREGLSVALMEAMAAGLPCVVSNIRGNVDLIDQGKGGFLCYSEDDVAFSDSLQKLIEDNSIMNDMSNWNLEKIKRFSVEKVMDITKKIYFE